eukprot:CAMPEP_0172775656 /NCGR_PEP_ID=MMETSP1074-20121228/198351_1 /TAXON_ID=2916 /ORGANISM="Ceratium fusus, Strain PA161109" /LENGTH=51 /DNA_ID=CAMNT_0013612299 /DNA_START=14 /DNA_END=166 /DNA_ORIENTATION=+
MTVNGQERACNLGGSIRWDNLVHGGICLVIDAQNHDSCRETSKASMGGAEM